MFQGGRERRFLTHVPFLQITKDIIFFGGVMILRRVTDRVYLYSMYVCIYCRMKFFRVIVSNYYCGKNIPRVMSRRFHLKSRREECVLPGVRACVRVTTLSNPFFFIMALYHLRFPVESEAVCQPLCTRNTTRYRTD